MKKNNKILTYGDYLHLEKILDAQHLKSEEAGKPTHHELFFIIIHQTYELWFKQISAELNHVIEATQQLGSSLQGLPEVLNGLERINKIQLLLNQQIPVMESLSPADFASFRDLLGTASGNQSYQYRLIEIRLGLYYKKPIDQEEFYGYFQTKQHNLFQTTIQQPNLYNTVETWLLHYAEDAKKYLNNYKNDLDTKLVELQLKVDHRKTDQISNMQIEQLKIVQDSFNKIMNKHSYQQELEHETRRLNYESFLSALYLCLNQNDAHLRNAYKILKKIIEMDELMALWRYHHALMVQRMIGNKFGSAGTTGFNYLRSTVEKSRVFTEFMDLSTYLFSDIYLDY